VLKARGTHAVFGGYTGISWDSADSELYHRDPHVRVGLFILPVVVVAMMMDDGGDDDDDG